MELGKLEHTDLQIYFEQRKVLREAKQEDLGFREEIAKDLFRYIPIVEHIAPWAGKKFRKLVIEILDDVHFDIGTIINELSSDKEWLEHLISQQETSGQPDTPKEE